MATSCALIVDDSRTAQHRLKKLLMRYKLEVDMAASAEEALGYLSYRMPTVIFMDHHMEGMDGFEALKIIKANPSTAMIPVIMYTAKSDDLYAGQAHALGALDTLSKNLMRPSRIEEVLAKLNIYPEDIKKPSPTPQPAPQKPIQTSTAAEPTPVAPKAPQKPLSSSDKSQPTSSTIDTSELKSQIARLFEIHIADVRSQIRDNTRFIVKRVASEIKNSAKHNERVSDISMSVLNEEARAETNKIGIVSTALLSLILVALAAISFQLLQANNYSKQLAESYERLADLNYQQNLLLDDVVIASQQKRPTPDTIDTKSLLEAISWATTIDMHFAYGEQPLDEKHVMNLQNLTFRLNEAGFRGFIELNIRLGNYCLVQQEGGDWVIPADDITLSDCDFLSEQKLDVSAENYTSIPYLQFEQTTVPIQNGDIEFIINVSAFENPIYPYPEARPDLSASQWNAIAQKNQQIVLLMDYPEE